MSAFSFLKRRHIQRHPNVSPLATFLNSLSYLSSLELIQFSAMKIGLDNELELLQGLTVKAFDVVAHRDCRFFARHLKGGDHLRRHCLAFNHAHMFPMLLLALPVWMSITTTTTITSSRWKMGRTRVLGLAARNLGYLIAIKFNNCWIECVSFFNS